MMRKTHKPLVALALEVRLMSVPISCHQLNRVNLLLSKPIAALDDLDGRRVELGAGATMAGQHLA